MWNFTFYFMWNLSHVKFHLYHHIVICNFMWNPFTCEMSHVISPEIISHVKFHMWFHVKSFHMWNVTCDSCEILPHVKCHMWFHVKSFHMWNVTCDFMWNPFICEISHVISCEIHSHVKCHIRSHNFTCFHMTSHEITCVNSCGFFVRESTIYHWWKT